MKRSEHTNPTSAVTEPTLNEASAAPENVTPAPVRYQYCDVRLGRGFEGLDVAAGIQSVEDRGWEFLSIYVTHEPVPCIGGLSIESVVNGLFRREKA
jgi:hypothetical protein